MTMSEINIRGPLVARHSDLAVYGKLAAVSMIWGGTFVAGRYLAGELSPLLAASLRFLLASLALLGCMALARIPLVRPSLKQFGQLALLGFFGIFFYNLCFFLGLQQINASRASLIVALNPVVIALASWALFKEPLSRRQLLGIVLCLSGSALVICSRDPAALIHQAGGWRGDLLILGCVLGWGVYSLFSRSLNQSLGPLQTVTYSILLGTLMLCAATLARGEFDLQALARLNLGQCLSLLYLGLMGSALAYIWYYDGLRRIGATRSGVFIALNPLTAVILGALLLGEPLSLVVGLGGVLILWGIYQSNKPLAGGGKKAIL
ncbi:DMT family transporter [Pseudomonas sp. Fl4BN1]|uniref:DMT family transporter n=1 Tax=Pseudomonas sp. Fl4BN1 TaxID=2697651 RepID=UPI003555C783